MMPGDGGGYSGVFRRLRDVAGRPIRAARDTARRVLHRHAPLLERFTRQMVSVNVLDCATRIGAQVFLSAIPLLFVIAAFAPEQIRQELLASLRAVFGLQGASLDEVRHVYSTESQNVRQTYGEIGIVVTVLSVTACSRALQRLCERSWHLPRASTRVVAWRWFAWFCGWLVVLVGQSGIRNGLGVGAWLGVPLSITTSTLLWWWTQRLLLGGRVAWLPLLPGAVLTAVGMIALFSVSRIYMPRTLNRSIAQFGPLGSVFTILSWIIVACIVISVAIASGYVLAHEQPLARLLGTDTRANEPTRDA